MLQGSGGIKTLPQLHVGGKFIGDCALVQVRGTNSPGVAVHHCAWASGNIVIFLLLMPRRHQATAMSCPLPCPQELVDSDELSAILGITK